jgi:hypothetical protein
MLQSLADRQAISELIYRYCRAMDRIDPELGYTIWHEDGEADYGEAFYRGTGRGFIDWVCGTHRTMLAHSHQVSNIIIELDGDTAGSEAYVTVALRFRDGDRLLQMTVRGRYVDRWSRRAGHWGIDKRVYLQDFDDIREVSASGVEGWGRRDREDRSYAVLVPAARTTAPSSKR